MCGRFILGDGTWANYHTDLSILWGTTSRISYNIKPTEPIDIVWRDLGRLATGTARWWFVPHWFKNAASEWKATTFNARIETAHDKPVFRAAWRNGRCLVPATGYYEWTGTRGNKKPWFIAPKQNLPVFFFAGLFARDADGQPSCAILTRAADPALEDLHPRMPVMLGSDELMPWLETGETDAATIETLGTSWRGQFDRRPVRPFKLADEGPELIEPAEFDL
ncbi:MAG: SOS response-associated peptidase [Rhodobacteraceae bacterium]|nr:SOS response-associated peptidase [Paracoccaceae bacterium]